MNSTAVIVENLKGAGEGGEASRATGVGPTGEDGKTIEAGEEGREGSMSGGKAVLVALIKATSERMREDEDQRGASWSTEKTPWRWRAHAEALAEQRRIAWLNVSGSSPQRGQSVES